VAPFLLALIPFYNFIGLKWDQNSILIPLWALTTWAFVRSFRDRHVGFAALAGAAAAASMLTKYWSVFLLVAIVIAALCDRRRGAYLRSAAPWVTVLTGAVLIAPHVFWLIRNDFPPLHWVENRRTAASLIDWFGSLSEYFFGTMGYAAVAVVTLVVLVRPSLAAVRDTLLPRDSQLRMPLIIFWLPLLSDCGCHGYQNKSVVAVEHGIPRAAAGRIAGIAADNGQPDSRVAHRRRCNIGFGIRAPLVADYGRDEV